MTNKKIGYQPRQKGEREMNANTNTDSANEQLARVVKRAKLSTEEIETAAPLGGQIQRAMQIVASRDTGITNDERGFGIFHIGPGEALACKNSLTPDEAALGMRYTYRYRRQVPPSLLAEIFDDMTLADLRRERRRTAKKRSRRVQPPPIIKSKQEDKE